MKSDNEWYNKWQRVVQWVTTSGTASDNEWQRVTTNDNEGQRVVQRMTTSDNEWYNDWQQKYGDVFKPILIIGFVSPFSKKISSDLLV